MCDQISRLQNDVSDIAHESSYFSVNFEHEFVCWEDTLPISYIIVFLRQIFLVLLDN